MLSKKDYLDKLEKSRSLPVIVNDRDRGEDYICNFEQTDIFNIFKQLIEDIFNPQPYEFEELHKGMWVWCHWFKKSAKEGQPVRIIRTHYDDGERWVDCQLGDGVGSYGFGAFIFCPLTKGMEYSHPIEITRIEYDLLRVWCERYGNKNCKLLNVDWMKGLKENGYLQNIDLSLTFKEILERVEIVDE